MARELAEHERDEEHPDDRDDGQPEVGGPAGAHSEHEQRVDAHHGRQVRERDSEVREQAEHAAQLRLIAEGRKPRVVIRHGSGMRHLASGGVHPVSSSSS